MVVRKFLEHHVRLNSKRKFLSFENQKITYSRFNTQVNRAANCFLRLGLQKGDNFAVMLPNSLEFLYCWFGLNKLGAVLVPVNPKLTGGELNYLLNHAEARGIVIHREYLPILQNILADLPALKHIIVVGERNANPKGVIDFRDCLQTASENLEKVDISENDPAVIIYTSGTTGKPKGVMLSNLSMVATGESTAYMTRMTAADTIITSNPLFHVNALCYATMASIAGNANLILLKRFSRSRIIEQVRQYGATIMVLAAAAMPMVWSRQCQHNDDENPLRSILTGGVPKEIYRNFEKRFQLKIQTAYAQTEAPVAIMAPIENTVGVPTPGIGVAMQHPRQAFNNELKIIDQGGNECPAGQHGQIIVRNPAVMIGYFKDPVQTAQMKIGGWIHTGDIGYRDESGYFFFVGRQKDLIRRRGELISPAQVEAVINAHPKVIESAVVGIPSGLGAGEEEIMAFVIKKTDQSLSPREIVQWCSGKLAEYKIPRFIDFRTKFSHTSLGKIQKNKLLGGRDTTDKGYDRLKDTIDRTLIK